MGESNESQKPLDFDLRNRMAAAIYEASDEYTRKLMANPRLAGCAAIEGDSKPVCFTLADAVIRELGLRKQSDKLVRRYITDWEADV
jgi:hypothetical protein